MRVLLGSYAFQQLGEVLLAVVCRQEDFDRRRSSVGRCQRGPQPPVHRGQWPKEPGWGTTATPASVVLLVAGQGVGRSLGAHFRYHVVQYLGQGALGPPTG